MTYATIKWSYPGITPPNADFMIEILNSASPTPKVPIGTVHSRVVEFTTGILSPGQHIFSTVVVDREGNRSKETVSSVVTVYPSSDVPPTDNLDVVLVGNPMRPLEPAPAVVEVKKPVVAPAAVKPVEVAKPSPAPQPKPADSVKK